MYPNQIKIARIILAPTGTYQDHFQTPIALAFTPQSDSVLSEMIGRGTTTASQVARQLSDSIGLAHLPHAGVSITNSWAERRMRFIMEIHVEGQHAGTSIEYVMGWTSHVGVTPNGFIDQNMTMVVNSTTMLRNSISFGMDGRRQNNIFVADNSHLLSSGMNGHVPIGQRTIRPQDALVLGNNSQFLDMGENVIDARGQLTTTPVKTDRSNESPAQWFAQFINSWMQACQSNRNEMDYSREEMVGAAVAQTDDNWVANDPFLVTIRDHSQTRGSSFTWGDLLTIDPSIVQRVSIIPCSTDVYQTLSTRGGAANWDDGTTENYIARVIANTIPGLMLACNYQSVTFQFNHVGEFLYSNLSSLTNQDIKINAEKLKNRILSEILPLISPQQSVGFVAVCALDAYGESIVDVTLGNDTMRYVSAGFADALFSTLMSTNQEHIVGLALGLGRTMDRVASYYCPSLANNQASMGAFSPSMEY
jgi:hypothetical protein